jgi:hypothetical protein
LSDWRVILNEIYRSGSDGNLRSCGTLCRLVLRRAGRRVGVGCL